MRSVIGFIGWSLVALIGVALLGLVEPAGELIARWLP